MGLFDRRRKVSEGARRLNAMLELHPEQWFETVRAALKKHRRVPDAAEDLGVSTRTLYRWIKENPKLARGIELPTAEEFLPKRHPHSQ